MTPATRRRFLRTISLSAFALMIGAGLAYIQGNAQIAQSGVGNRISAIAPAAGPSVAGVQVGGPFTLVDENKATVTEKTYDGKYKLIFFGFSSCPMICPVELAKMAKVLKALGAKATEIAPLFITTDPENDTPDVLKQYTDLYHPEIIGLTGTPAQVEAAEKDFRVYANQTVTANGGKSVDHSSFTYLMGPHDEFLSIYRSEDNADFIVKDLKAKMKL